MAHTAKQRYRTQDTAQGSGAPQQTTAHSRAASHANKQEHLQQSTPAENNSGQPDPATNTPQPQATTHSTGKRERSNRARTARHDAVSSTLHDRQHNRKKRHRATGQNTTTCHDRGPGSGNRGQQHGARTQPNTSTPHSTGQNTDRSTTRHDAPQHTTHRTTTSWGLQDNQHTPEKKKRTAAGRGGGRRTTPDGTPQRGKTPHKRDQHNTHQRKAKQHDKTRRNRATPPQHPRATTGCKCRRTRPKDKAQKEGTGGSAESRKAASTARRNTHNATGNNTQ